MGWSDHQVRLSRLGAAATLLALGAVAAATAVAGEAWPQWGGPDRNFRSRSSGLAGSWPADGPRLIWRRDLGAGYSSIVSDGERLYTMYRAGGFEVVIALDPESGKTIWKYRYAAPLYADQAKDFGKGPNATPLIADGRIYTVGFTSKLHCVSAASGEPVWSHDLIEKYGGQIQQFGHAASPIRYGDTVVVLVGGRKHGAIGFDLVDGSVRWRTPPLEFSYASPTIIDVEGDDQLVFMTPSAVIGVGMSDGRIRWRHPHENKHKTNCQGPWWDENGLLFVSSHAGAGSRTLRLTRGERTTDVEEVARNEHVQFFYSNAIRMGDYIFGVSDSTLLAHNVKTGEDIWRRDGFPSANLVQAGGLTILLDEEGKLTLATLTPAKLTVHAMHALMKKPARTAPTLLGQRLYLRDSESIVAVDLASPTALAAGKP